MKLKFPKQITIGATKFKVIQDKKTNGGSFTYWEEEKKGKQKLGNITIGTYLIDINPAYVLGVIIHELKEIIQVEQGTRYKRPSEPDSYQFLYDHKEHTDFCSRLAETLDQFIR